MFTSGTTDLEVELSSGFLELAEVGSELGELDVHGGADGGAKIGGAEGQETKTVVVAEWNTLFDVIDSRGEATEDLSEITTHLHGDEAEMILFIAPDQESLVLVVVDTTSSGPEAASVGSLQEAVTFLEEEMVINELLLDFLGHASEWEVGTLEFTFETRKSGGDLLFHFLVLGLSEAGVEGVSFHGATTTDAGGDYVLAIGVNIDKAVDITEVLGGMAVGVLESDMVILNDGVKQGSEEGVGLGIGSIETNARVQVLNTRLDDIEEGGTELGLQALELVEDISGKVFLKERLAVSGGFELLEASLKFLNHSGICHYVIC